MPHVTPELARAIAATEDSLSAKTRYRQSLAPVPNGIRQQYMAFIPDEALVSSLDTEIISLKSTLTLARVAFPDKTSSAS